MRSLITTVSTGRSRQTSLFDTNAGYANEVRQVLVLIQLKMREWRRRVRCRNELITLCDRDLRDLGWTKAEVEAERRKPFWRA
jgi:uncharacterized protein YjiS (DUF1127 family)